MRFLTLSSDSSNFEYSCIDNTLKLKWNIKQDFSNIHYVGISSFIFTGFKPSNTERLLKISTNIISRTNANPKRDILNLCIRKNSTVAQLHLNMSKYFSIRDLYRPRKLTFAYVFILCLPFDSFKPTTRSVSLKLTK